MARVKLGRIVQMLALPSRIVGCPRARTITAWTIAFVALAASLPASGIALTPGSASSATASLVVPDGSKHGVLLRETEALNADATNYARAAGVSVEEAHRRLSLQPEIGRYIAAVEELKLPGFAGAWVEHAPEYVIVLGFTSRPSQIPFLVDSPVPVLVRADLRSTVEELIGAQRKMIAEDLDTFNVAGTYVSLPENAVVIQLEPDSPNQDRLVDAETRISSIRNVEITFEVLLDPASDDAVYGGRPIGGCTQPSRCPITAGRLES